MKRLLKRFLSRSVISYTSRRRPLLGQVMQSRIVRWLLLAIASGFTLILVTSLLYGVWDDPARAQSGNVQKQEDQLIRDFTLPKAPTQAPVYQPAPPAQAPEPAPAPTTDGTTPAPTTKPAPKPVPPAGTSEYVLEFNRSPVVGNRFRMQGVYATSRLGFTRPRLRQVQSAKAVIRFQHSPALVASRSNLTVQVNGSNLGSTPLNRKQSQIGELAVTIPPSLLQDTNEITMVVQQNTDPKCSNPADPSLWTEVLPDSKLVFGYKPQPVPLDFSRFPYPFFDDLSLDANRLAYVPPAQMTEAWLTTAARFQAGMGRLADFRPLETRLVKQLSDLQWNDRLVIIGTPAEQPLLKSLKLPFAIANNQIIDGNKLPLPPDEGVLMLTTTTTGSNPILVITGNGAEGVQKAVQFLVQPQNRQMSTGQAMLVTKVPDVPSPSTRQWARHLPEANEFKLSDLKGSDDKPFEDVTVRGSTAPVIDIDFRALPDDRFTRGSSMNLVYSYSPQVNPRNSTVEVLLDGVSIAGKRLTNENGANKEVVNIVLPESQLKPTSKLQIAFRLNPKDPGQCGIVTDQQLWGTIHSESNFKLSREISVQLPDLALLTVGYPFAAPQDLSQAAIVLPDAPSRTDLLTLLAFSGRMGRLSRAEAVKLEVYTAGTLPEAVRGDRHLVGIGTREKFPFPEAFQAEGFSLGNFFSRLWNQTKIQTLPDTGGMIRSVISPWKGDRALLALTAQTETGLNTVQDVLNKDLWFFRLKGDTVLINQNQNTGQKQNPESAYDADTYTLAFLQQATPRRLENTNWFNKATRLLQENWVLLPLGIMAVSLVLYGIAQLYLKRLAAGVKK